MKKIYLFIAFFAFAGINVNAQDLAQLVEQFKSETRLSNIKKMEASKEDAKDSGVKALDQLAKNATSILEQIFETNDTLPSVYERVMGETMDGVSNENVEKPEVSELETVAVSIAESSKSIAAAGADLQSAQNDISKIRNPLQIKKATSSLNYSKNVINFAKDEIALQGKMIKTLLEQLKSSVPL